MKRFSSLGRLASWTATIAIISGPCLAAAAEDPAATAASPVGQLFSVADVTLDDAGALTGQVVSTQGQPVAHQAILLDDGSQRWSATTDAEGQFRFGGLKGGSYRVQAGQQVKLCRAWKAGTAPPSATRGLMLVEGQQTILGQYCGSPVGCGTPVHGGLAGCKRVLSNPLVIGGAIAAAIAIPVAIHNADDDDAS